MIIITGNRNRLMSYIVSTLCFYVDFVTVSIQHLGPVNFPPNKVNDRLETRTRKLKYVKKITFRIGVLEEYKHDLIVSVPASQ